MKKKGWEVKKLGEVANILMGQSPPSDFYTTEKKGLPFFQGNADFGKLHPTIRMYCTNPIRISEAKDILFSVRAPIGAINIALEKCCIGRGVASIRAIEGKTDYKYIYHSLSFYKEKLISLGTGSTFKAINKKVLTDLDIPTPPIPIQKQIVKELDTLSGIITKKKAQLADLDTLAQAIFYEMFGDPVENSKGWDVKRLDEVCSNIYGGGTPSKNTNLYYENGTVLWVTPKDMKYKFITNSKIKITQHGVTNSSAKLIPIGAILMVLRSGILKHTLPIAIAKKELTVNQDLKAFICSPCISNMYLYECLNAFESYLLTNVRAVTADNIEFSIIKKLAIPLPPLPLQNQFAERIEAIEKQKTLINQSITDVQLLFDYTMDKYFN